MKQWYLRLRGYVPVAAVPGERLWMNEVICDFTTVLCRHPKSGKVATFEVVGRWLPHHFVKEEE